MRNRRYKAFPRYSFGGFKHFFSELFYRLAHMAFLKKVISAGAIAAAIVVVVLFTTGTITAGAAGIEEDPAQQDTAAEEVLPEATPTPTPAPTPQPTPTPDPTLQQGMEDARVAELQQRLMDLGYLDLDEPTNLYGPATNYAVQLFQRQHELEMDGICGPQTLEMIFSPECKPYTLLEGTSGEDVNALQSRLEELGYLDKSTGYYGTETIEAVKAFQAMNGIGVDGKTGEVTLALIYSADAEPSAEKAHEARRQGNIDSFLSSAEDQLGKKYVWGAQGPNTFDCSGLVTYCLREAGSTTGRLNAAGFSQNSRWEKIGSIDNLRRGDLIFFTNKSGSRVGHVGIVVGDGMMIDASSANGKVVYRTYDSSYWRSHFVCGRRPW
ncbi:MAG: peptidoglycan-binding protein [Christensenellaceae bacterium]|jgi:cell wall-associated NlpC family hydrolase